jgi:hypothetical protein
MKPKSLSSEKAKKILSDGEVRGTPLTSKQRGFMGARAGGAPLKPGNTPPAPVKPPRTNLGGNAPPARPKAKDTPVPSKHMAIGERPVLAKTAAKMKRMR